MAREETQEFNSNNDIEHEQKLNQPEQGEISASENKEQWHSVKESREQIDPKEISLDKVTPDNLLNSDTESKKYIDEVISSVVLENDTQIKARQYLPKITNEQLSLALNNVLKELKQNYGNEPIKNLLMNPLIEDNIDKWVHDQVGESQKKITNYFEIKPEAEMMLNKLRENLIQEGSTKGYDKNPNFLSKWFVNKDFTNARTAWKERMQLLDNAFKQGLTKETLEQPFEYINVAHEIAERGNLANAIKLGVQKDIDKDLDAYMVRTMASQDVIPKNIVTKSVVNALNQITQGYQRESFTKRQSTEQIGSDTPVNSEGYQAKISSERRQTITVK